MSPDPARFWDLSAHLATQENMVDWEGFAPAAEVEAVCASTLAGEWRDASPLVRDLVLHLAYEQADQGDGVEDITADWLWATWNAVDALSGARWWMRRDA